MMELRPTQRCEMDGLERHLQSQTIEHAGLLWHRLRWRAMASRVPRHRDLDLLDVGAGTGVLGELLAQQRPLVRYSFFEPVESFERQMEQRWGASRNAAQQEDLRAFSIVTFLDVIEHVPDDFAFLERLVVGTAPGTLFILTVPALPRLWSQWDVALGHYRRYTRRSLRRLLMRLPVDVDEVSYLFPELLVASLINRRRRGVAEAEWPTLPRVLDGILYRLGVPSVLLRRFWPAGTSLIATFRRV
jgi:hypothetical protein